MKIYIGKFGKQFKVIPAVDRIAVWRSLEEIGDPMEAVLYEVPQDFRIGTTVKGEPVLDGDKLKDFTPVSGRDFFRKEQPVCA